jgi:hypothetical protein
MMNDRQAMATSIMMEKARIMNVKRYPAGLFLRTNNPLAKIPGRKIDRSSV